jgi:hypothetical protein
MTLTRTALLVVIILIINSLSAVAQQVQLVGKWTNCRQEYRRMRQTASGVKEEVSFLTSFSCPTITFRANGTGQVIGGGKDGEAFTWQQVNTKLVVKMLNANLISLLSSDSYTLSILEAGTIALTNIKGDSYILTRK